MAEPAEDLTVLLVAWSGGDWDALDQLLPLVYENLRRLAHAQRRRERPGGTIGTTALVHEAYLRLVDQNRSRPENRAHFFGLAATVMRRVLLDDARKRRASKRGSGAPNLSLNDVTEPGIAPDGGLLALDEALTRLGGFDAHLSRVVELRFFGGLTFEEIAEVLRISTTSAWRDWNTARAWLYDSLSTG